LAGALVGGGAGGRVADADALVADADALVGEGGLVADGAPVAEGALVADGALVGVRVGRMSVDWVADGSVWVGPGVLVGRSVGVAGTSVGAAVATSTRGWEVPIGVLVAGWAGLAQFGPPKKVQSPAKR
jgi:hypothetical protein